MEEYKKLLDEGIDKIYTGNLQEAHALISKSIKLKGDWEISYFYRAVASQELEHFNDAILDYTKALSINPDMADAYYNRAKILLESKKDNINIDKIIDDLEEALKLDNKFIDALYAMAAAQKKKGEYHLALEYLERLLEIQPDSIHARAFKKLLLQKYIV